MPGVSLIPGPPPAEPESCDSDDSGGFLEFQAKAGAKDKGRSLDEEPHPPFVSVDEEPHPPYVGHATVDPIPINRPGNEGSSAGGKKRDESPPNAMNALREFGGLHDEPRPFGNHKYRGGPNRLRDVEELYRAIDAEDAAARRAAESNAGQVPAERPDGPSSKLENKAPEKTPRTETKTECTGVASSLEDAEANAEQDNSSWICAHPSHKNKGDTPAAQIPPRGLGRDKNYWQPELPALSVRKEHEPSELTIGVEWEILIDPEVSPYGNLKKIPREIHLEQSIRAGTCSNMPHIYHIVKALNDAGIRAASSAEIRYALDKPGYAKARFPLVNHDLPPNVRFNDFYVVRVDGTVSDDFVKPDNIKWLPVEIASAVVTVDRILEIDAAFSVVLNKFSAKTNISCGLHVHIGNGTNGYSLQWMRTSAAMCWAIAPLFDNFHPACRGPCDNYVRGIRYFSNAAQDGKTLSTDGSPEDELDAAAGFVFPIPEGGEIGYQVPPIWPGRPQVAYGVGPHGVDPESPPYSFGPRKLAPIEKTLCLDELCPQCPGNVHMAWRGVKRLLDTESTTEVLNLMKTAQRISGRLSYNFNNLRFQGVETAADPRTIEFRQHAGTTDLVAILCWARVCASIVEICRPVRSPTGILQGGTGLSNNPRAIEVARRAVEGSLCLTHYDAYSFIEDIGSIVAYQAYTYGRMVNRRNETILKYSTIHEPRPTNAARPGQNALAMLKSIASQDRRSMRAKRASQVTETARAAKVRAAHAIDAARDAEAARVAEANSAAEGDAAGAGAEDPRQARGGILGQVPSMARAVKKAA